MVNSGYMNPPIRAIPSIRFGFVLVEFFDGVDIPHMMVSRFFFFSFSSTVLRFWLSFLPLLAFEKVVI